MKKQFTTRLEPDEITYLKNLADAQKPSVTASTLARHIIVEYLQKEKKPTSAQKTNDAVERRKKRASTKK